MATLASRIDTVTNNISTAKTNLKTAIINKGGNVSSDSPTFEELKNGIEGISTGTTINYEEYYPDLNEISGIRNIDENLPASIPSYSYSTMQSPAFYISYLGSIFYGYNTNFVNSYRSFSKYNLATNTITVLYSFESLLNSNQDIAYEDDGSINLIPYDSNVDDVTSPSLKYYFCQGNIFGNYTSYRSSKGVYSYDLITNTASLLAKFSHDDNCFFNRVDSEGNIDKEYLYAISANYTCYVSKMNKSTFAVSLINSSNFWSSDQSHRDWHGGSPFVYPWIEDKVYMQIQFRNEASDVHRRSGSYSFLTNTFSNVDGRCGCCHNQLPLLLRKGSWWGKNIQGYSYVLNDDSLPSIYTWIFLEYLLTSYSSSTKLVNPPYLLPIYNFPFLYSFRGRIGFYTTFHYLLPIKGICECKFNQVVFQMRKKDNGLWALSDIAIIHPKNTTFVTEEGYSYIIIEGPITGYIKYL